MASELRTAPIENVLPTHASASRCSVVHVALGTSIGGMEKLLVEFAKHADRSRFKLSFVSLQHRGKLADEIETCGWHVTDFDKTPGLHPTLVLRLARYLRRMRADVVHTHNTAAMFYGAVAAKLAGVPSILHTRHGQRFGATSRQTRVFRYLSRSLRHVVSVCDDGTRRTIQDGITPVKALTIHNGIDLKRFAFVGPKHDGAAVLVARLSAEKDVTTLIAAMRLLSTHRNEKAREIRLRIIGDGEQQEALQAQARSLALQSRIEFLGERSDVRRQLSTASMFVLPSLTEGISLTLLEAMARGLPVIATRVGGTPEVVVNRETGFLVPPSNPHAMAEAMLAVHLNPVRAVEMGRRGRTRVEQHFNIEGMVRQYEHLYAPELFVD